MTRGGTGCHWSGRPRALRRGTTSTACPGSDPSAPPSTSTIRRSPRWIRSAWRARSVRRAAAPRAITSNAEASGRRRPSGRLMGKNGRVNTAPTSTRRPGRPGYDRETLLDTIIEVFTTHGYDAASLDMLARRLGISKAALYHRSEEHTSELQSRGHLVCRLLLEKKKVYKRAHIERAQLDLDPTTL